MTAAGEIWVTVDKWGSPGSGSGRFQYPWGVATDAAGIVYVADVENNRIQKFTATGTYVCQWGSLGSGDGRFNGPLGVATDATGDVYVTDRVNQRIQNFRAAVTPTNATTWGRLKRLYH
jgi:DNA-binding beta-propeller fold protein YncE